MRSPAAASSPTCSTTGTRRSYPKVTSRAARSGAPSIAGRDDDGRRSRNRDTGPSSGSQMPAAASRGPSSARTEPGDPNAIGVPSRPSARTRSAIGQAALARCSTSTIVARRAARNAVSCSKKRTAPSGSRLAVGSSRTRRPGRAAITPASARRCRWPPESSRVGRRPDPRRPTSSSATGTRSCIASRGHARFSSPNATSSSTRSITTCRVGSWKTRPARAARPPGGNARVSMPSTVSDPRHSPGSSRGIRPDSASPSVLLPDPEGPTTRREAPAGTWNSSPSRAALVDPRYVNPKSCARTSAGCAASTIATVRWGSRRGRRWAGVRGRWRSRRAGGARARRWPSRSP